MNYPISRLSPLLASEPDLVGLNVTIPYKQQVIAYLDRLEPACRAIGAVNCIKVSPDELVGFNTDYIGFRTSLENWLGAERPAALILGTGGASNAVAQALTDLNIPFLKVSRTSQPDSQFTLSYRELSRDIMSDYRLVINTTPLGTYPNTSEMPPIPLEHINSTHWIYDLVYNPAETSLMKEAFRRGQLPKTEWRCSTFRRKPRGKSGTKTNDSWGKTGSIPRSHFSGLFINPSPIAG